jgi:hypothetical protein
MRVYNTAGQYVQSATTTFTTSASVLDDRYTVNNFVETDLQSVTSGTMTEKFFNWSGTSYQNVTSLAIYANIPVTNYSTVSTNRNPILVMYRETTATVRTYLSLYDLSPLRAVSGGGAGGIFVGSFYTPAGTGNTSYEFANNNQKISIRGGGSISSNWAPNEIIRVKAIVYYTQRTDHYI